MLMPQYASPVCDDHAHVKNKEMIGIGAKSA
jgi:hypothetical protein